MRCLFWWHDVEGDEDICSTGWSSSPSSRSSPYPFHVASCVDVGQRAGVDQFGTSACCITSNSIQVARTPSEPNNQAAGVAYQNPHVSVRPYKLQLSSHSCVFIPNGSIPSQRDLCGVSVDSNKSNKHGPCGWVEDYACSRGQCESRLIAVMVGLVETIHELVMITLVTVLQTKLMIMAHRFYQPRSHMWFLAACFELFHCSLYIGVVCYVQHLCPNIYFRFLVGRATVCNP